MANAQQQQMGMMMAQMNARLNQLEEQVRVKPFAEQIMNCTGVLVKQKANALEMLAGMEMPNVYNVYPSIKNGGKKKKEPMLVCKERRELCQSRGNIQLRGFDQAGENETKILEMMKPFSCKCPALAPPTMLVHQLSPDGQRHYIGKICDNWDCTQHSFSIFDDKDTEIYSVFGECCQCNWGTVTFDLWKGHKEVRLPQRLVRTPKSFAHAAMGSDADNFDVGFPDGAPYNHRVLLMALALMVDIQLFETHAADQHRHGSHGYGYGSRYGRRGYGSSWGDSF